MSARLAPNDWCDAGLALLRDEGMSSLTVDRMCTALGRTKGSFYHHFRDLDAFLTMLLVRWEDTLTDVPIALSRAEPAVNQRAARLDEVVEQLDQRLDLSVRAWALRDERARAAVARVDTRRIAYLTELHAAAGAADARAAAQWEYVAFLGTQQLCAVITPEETSRVVSEVRQSLDLSKKPCINQSVRNSF